MAGAEDINARGWILGHSYRPDGERESWPVIWKPNGQIIDLFKNINGEARY